MGIVKLAGVAWIVLAAQAFAASTVDYTVELSPYNSTYVTNYKAGGTSRTYFTADGTFGGPAIGNSTDNQQYAAGSIITWDLKVAVSGVHSQPGHASDGKPVAGLANLVFNLQLEKLNGASWDLVSLGSGSASVQGWYSAINDGTGGDPVAPAALALSYNVGNLGPGRAVDAWNDYVSGTPDGGPKLGLFTYPTLVAGKLLGQGCGYTAWSRSAYQTATTPGVGMDTIIRPSGATTPGLGIKPICEGQINTAGLATGTYRLRVTKGAGVNVLRGDLDLAFVGASSFAVAANVVNEDTITFQLVTPGHLAVSITPAEAVAAGAQFAIDGGAWQDPGTIDLAPGSYTVSYKDIVGWTKPADAQVTITAGGTTSITGDYVAGNGTLTVTLAPAGAVAAGAQFAVNGGEWQNAGQVSLPAGSYTVTFKPVVGYATPASQNPTISPGVNTAITGTYTLVPSPEIAVDAWDGFSRTVEQGQNADSDSFHVSNAVGLGSMVYSVESSAAWMLVAMVSPGDGVVTDSEVESVAITYATSGLSAGTYYGSIIITCDDATNSPVELPVTVKVQVPAPEINVSAGDGFARTITEGENASTDSFTVSNALGIGTMSYTVSSDQAWATVAVVAPGDGVIVGAETETVNVTYTTASLTPGTYNASITVTAAGASNTPVVLPVTLEVKEVQLPPTVPVGVASVKLQDGVAYGVPFVGQTVTTNPGGATNTTVECRANGVTQIMIPFDVAVTAVDGAIDAGSEVVVTGGTINSLDLTTPGVILVNMTTTNQNGSCVQVTLTNIAKVAGGPAMAATTYSIACLRGDVTGNGSVDIGDVNAVKAASGSALDSSAVAFRRDVTANGAIDVGDVNNVKSLSGNSAPQCP